MPRYSLKHYAEQDLYNAYLAKLVDNGGNHLGTFETMIY